MLCAQSCFTNFIKTFYDFLIASLNIGLIKYSYFRKRIENIEMNMN